MLEDLCLLSDRPELAGTAYALLARITWENQLPDQDTIKKIKTYQRKAEQLLPQTAEAYYLRAMTTLSIHQKLDLLTKALRLNPKHDPSRRLQALTYQASRKYRQLNEDALLLIYERPQDPLGYSLRAVALKELGNDREAVMYYDRALALIPATDPQHAELNGRRCECLMRMGQYERVLKDVQVGLEVTPKAAVLHFHAICAWTALGQYEQASAQFQRALDVDPNAVSTDPGRRSQRAHLDPRSVYEICLRRSGGRHPVASTGQSAGGAGLSPHDPFGNNPPQSLCCQGPSAHYRLSLRLLVSGRYADRL
jgi:tetratricopeptide (TPR) repeat protein